MDPIYRTETAFLKIDVYQRDDAERDERVFNGEPRQAGIREFAARTGKGTGQCAGLADVVVDLNGKTFAGCAQREVEGGVDVGKG